MIDLTELRICAAARKCSEIKRPIDERRNWGRKLRALVDRIGWRRAGFVIENRLGPNYRLCAWIFYKHAGMESAERSRAVREDLALSPSTDDTPELPR